jgi:aspartate/methionine/tyrosine aminotransferase
MQPFGIPPYPYDRLNDARALAVERHGSAIDMSIGTPYDAPPAAVVEALSASGSERGYPASIGSPTFRTAAASWLDSQFGVSIDPMHLGATIGLKEFVAGVPHWFRLRDPDRDTVLYPAVSYPSYAMGAELAHGRAVAVPVDENWRLRLDAIDPADIARASLLWINSPGNPAGALEDLPAAAAWGRQHGVPVLSDECYIEFTWNGPGKTILQSGSEGVLAVHSLSKRSNLAGVRAGFYAGDPELVHWLQEIRKHAGSMPPGPTQAAAAVALSDQTHVEEQRATYHRRLLAMQEFLAVLDLDAPMPEGGFYLWVQAPGGDAWALTNQLAEQVGLIVSPGEFYGVAGQGHVRVAVVQDDAAIAELHRRLA